MNLRKFIGVLSSVTALSFTSNSTLSSLILKCDEGSRSSISTNYVNGRGRELVNCIENNLRREHSNLRETLGVLDTTLPGVGYATLPTGTFGIYLNDSILSDTSMALYLNGRVTCVDLIRHELVHALIKRKSMEIGNGIWPKYSTPDIKNFTLDDYGRQFISEGLASYFGNGVRIRELHRSWPRNIRGLYCSNRYSPGDYLVTRILDEFGAEAVPFMIRDPPRGTEVFNPREWQNRIRGLIINSQRSRR
ncbi:MAG: hypothetical protein AABX50_01000 [Nanoarchaeota archaeon]